MAAKGEETLALPAVIPAKTSDPVRDPAEHQTAEEYTGKVEEEEEEKEIRSRETKRRKTCPAALEKFSSAVKDDKLGGFGRGGFSFSFDTRSIAPIERTPKFGSFKSSADLGLGAAEEEEEEEEKREVDGIKEKEDGQDGKEEGVGSGSGTVEG